MNIAELILEYLKILIWPSLILGIILLFRNQINNRIRDLQKADLPGGVSFSFRAEIREAEKLSEQVSAEPSPQAKETKSLLTTEANLRMIELGFQPSPSGLNINYYRDLAVVDPNLALAGLRLEIDVIMKNLAKGFNIAITPQESSEQIVRKLLHFGALNKQQGDLIGKILRLTNAGVRGSVVMRSEAEQIIDTARILVEQYISWLSWGLEDGRKPNQAD